MNKRVVVGVILLLLDGVYALPNTNIGYFWHITDIHYDPTYWSSQLSCNDQVPSPGRFGDQWCDSPWELVASSIAELIFLKPDVDFIIWTGDNGAHIKDANITEDIYVDILGNITSILKRGLFKGVKVYPSFGNHDFYPHDQASPNGSRIYREAARMWADWIGAEAGLDLNITGGYYSVKPTATVRLLALNTVLYFRSNNLTRDIDDPAGQLVWMTQQLTLARDKKEKVIVTGHIPPGLMVPGLLHWFHSRHKVPFIDILLQFSDVIVAAHFGHDHVDSFKLLQDAEGKKAVAHFSAPSITPQRYKIPSEVGPPHNPGLRLITYNKVTGRNINYDQYTMDLTGSNRAGDSIWTKLYSFQEAYRVPDMSVASLKRIFSRLQSDNEAEFPKYCPLMLLNSREISCTYKARAEVFCGWLKDNLAEVKNCNANFTITNGAEDCCTNYRITSSFVLSVTPVLLIFLLLC